MKQTAQDEYYRMAPTPPYYNNAGQSQPQQY
jgi:hypothetical protein